MIHVRDAGTSPADDDAAFIVAALDSAVVHLGASDNADMWGPRLFSDRPGFLASTRADVLQSERFRRTAAGEPIRLFIAQARAASESISLDGLDVGPRANPQSPRLAGESLVRVAAMALRENHFSAHVTSCAALEPRVHEAQCLPGGFIYIDLLVADHRVTRATRVGAGPALVQTAQQHARNRGATAVYVDCWTGGTRGLVPYYEKHGFQTLQEFSVPRKDGTQWPAVLMRLSIPGTP